ncbi:MAG: hypothetical protein BMS9Abin34_168 [Patescibacteria group bacterium]|nr:MAG: hypothetical protein BMS9Abin34_168 [Patescibacteria group bacterium]
MAVLINMAYKLVGVIGLSMFLLGSWYVPSVFSLSSPVIINEVMYNPSEPEGCTEAKSEWIELLNTTLDPVSLAGWELGDANSDGKNPDTNDLLDGAAILGKGYLIIVADSSCFKLMYPGVPDDLIFDLPSNNIGSGLNNSGDSVILRAEFVEQDRKDYAEGGALVGMSLALAEDGSWKEADPTPGTENSFQEEEEEDSQQAEQEKKLPMLKFSPPSAVSAGREFSVTVELTDFESGTYGLKVLIGRDGKFVYGNTKGSSGWLSQNGSWSEMPQAQVGSSGSAGKTVLAKVDEDTGSGSHSITVSIAKKDADGYKTLWPVKELETKPLKVSALVKSQVTSSTKSNESGLGDRGSGSGVVYDPPESKILDQGEVLGEEAPQKDPLKLNFYIILGVLGMAVGSWGLVLAVRQTPAL